MQGAVLLLSGPVIKTITVRMQELANRAYIAGTKSPDV